MIGVACMLRKPIRLSAALALLVPLLVVGFGLTALAQSSPSPGVSPGASPGASQQAGQGGSNLPGDPTKGMQIYNQNCTTCHGAALEGGIGPPLNPIKNLGNTKDPLAPDYLVKTITDGLSGVGGYGQMPPKGNCSKCSDQDIADAAAYIIQQNKSKPGGTLSPAELARSTVMWTTIGILGMLLITWILARYNMRWIARRAAARRSAERAAERDAARR
jgi:mono/diheme cytochrome c family protein